MAKPTHTSVTEEPCTCGYLERAADDPTLPIVYDAQLNEYHFKYPSPCAEGECEQAKASLMIYHCPFCGGITSECSRCLEVRKHKLDCRVDTILNSSGEVSPQRRCTSCGEDQRT